MQYKKILKKEGASYNPFVCEKPENIIETTKNFHVFAARAPRCEDHLLIVPIKEVVLLNELSKNALAEMMELISKWNAILHTKHSDVTLVLKDGYLGGKSEKSVQHLHFHLAPSCTVVAKINGRLSRNFYDQKTYEEVIKAFKKKYKIKK